MSSLTLEFAILFLKAINIDFPQSKFDQEIPQSVSADQFMVF